MKKELKVLLIDGLKGDKIHSRLGHLFLPKLGRYCNLAICGTNYKDLIEYVQPADLERIKLVEHRREDHYANVIDRVGWKPDVVLFHMYNSAKALAPVDISTWKIPKAIIMYDTYTHTTSHSCEHKIEWVRDTLKSQLVIRRGCNEWYNEELWTIPSVWLPFSVREESYHINLSEDWIHGRHAACSFIGSGYESNNYLYDHVRESIDNLKEKGLLAYQGIVGRSKYPQALRMTLLALGYTLGSLGHPAKLFEIMGSGCGLITTPIKYHERLFGEEHVCWTYTDNKKQLINIVERLLNPKNIQEVQKVTGNALKVISERHMDDHRAKELVNILSALAGGEPIPSVWE